jgi:DNA mismatch repair ATPase MutL
MGGRGCIFNKIMNFVCKLVSDATRRSGKSQESSRAVVDEADLYENNQRTAASQPAAVPTSASSKRKGSRQNSPNTPIVSKIATTKSTSKEESTKSSSKQQQQSNGSKSNQQEKNYRVFIALFEYDPFKMSPNTDSCQEELPFKEGELIKVYGEQDADGFYYGESAKGRFGYIPCNMVSELQVDDPEVVKQLLNDSNNQQQQPDTISDKQKRKSMCSLFYF